MAFLDLAAHQPRRVVGLAADGEEGGAHALRLQRVQDQGRRIRVRAVVEGEDHLVVGERQGVAVGLPADLKAAFRADLLDPRRAERLGPAFGRPRAGQHERRRERPCEARDGG